MTSSEMAHFICHRKGILDIDEALDMVDVVRNPQIVRMEYRDGTWNVWDADGTRLVFSVRR